MNNDEAMQLKTAIGVALVYLCKYRDRREDDLQMAESARNNQESVARAIDDIAGMSRIINQLQLTQ